ncbi:MAG: amidohydrolase [Bacteroidales bacterium]|nr:amidohydrolase [Bacteroidales bacterium]
MKNTSLPIEIQNQFISLELKEKVRFLSNYYFEQVVQYRRHIHRYPDLSGQEGATASFVCRCLQDMGLSVQYPVAGHGVVACITGFLPGRRCVALRADMDALPLQEHTGTDYASCRPGIMHACGHDAHTAMLIGSLLILNTLKNSFGGTIKAIFQPSEEEYGGGAPEMIEAGILHNPEVDVIFGQHVTPGLSSNCVGFREGAFMASTDEIHLTIHGKGGHAALPAETINPVPAGVAIVQGIQDFVQTHAPKDTPTVQNFGKFIANGRANLIPDTAELSGTLRTFDEIWREKVLNYINAFAQETARKMGCICEVDIRRGYPVLYNSPEVTSRAKKEAETYLGKHNVTALPTRMTAEDFAYFLQEKQGVFWRLGSTGDNKNTTFPLHNSQFDIDENALKTGMGLMAWIALAELCR